MFIFCSIMRYIQLNVSFIFLNKHLFFYRIKCFKNFHSGFQQRLNPSSLPDAPLASFLFHYLPLLAIPQQYFHIILLNKNKEINLDYILLSLFNCNLSLSFRINLQHKKTKNKQNKLSCFYFNILSSCAYPLQLGFCPQSSTESPNSRIVFAKSLSIF